MQKHKAALMLLNQNIIMLKAGIILQNLNIQALKILIMQQDQDTTV